MKNFLILFVMAAVFLLARMYIAPETLIVMLNGLFVGSLVSLVFVLRSLTWASFRGRLKYEDVSMFTLGLMLWLVAGSLGVATSIYIKATDISVPAFTLTAAARYCLICGMLVMAYSPDAEQGFFDGRDRKVVAGSVVLGLIVAAIVVYIQAFSVLA